VAFSVSNVLCAPPASPQIIKACLHCLGCVRRGRICASDGENE
jgi:hypothetical protein